MILSATLLFVAATIAVATSDRGADAESFPNIVDHFKYGSIGAEERAGIPFYIWRVLPTLFPDKLPKRPGDGFERLGFLFDKAPHGRPIGTSFTERQVDRIGLNCATCHVGTLRESPTSPRRIMIGMPANQMDLQGYARFLTACATDPRFTADNLLAAIRNVSPEFGTLDAIFYRFFVVKATRDGILERDRENVWIKPPRPPAGPGRVDTFSPYKAFRGLPIGPDDPIGTADLPSLWNQRPRKGLWLHWDGNNDSVEERNKSAAIGAGCSPRSLNIVSLDRIQDWIWDLKAPAYPTERIDKVRAARGAQIWQAECASCHAIGGPKTGQVTPIADVGTDAERLNSFSDALAAEMNKIGEGYPWQFKRFRKTNGYANAPLDGLWLRAPYLHNGSVPHLRALLFPEQRPATFYRAYDVYDWTNVGFVSSGPEAQRDGVLFDTRLRGNGNAGHLYGTHRSASDREDLLEYLKTL
jgi:Cytochrome c